MDDRLTTEPAYHAIYIAAPRERIWSRLTDPVATRAFHFGRSVESSWDAGAAIRFVMPDGSVDVGGRILEIDPPRLLRFTSEVERKRGIVPPSVVAFELEPFGEMCRIAMTETYAGPVDPRLVEGSRRAWPVILSRLKSLIETGRAPEIDLGKLLEEGAD